MQNTQLQLLAELPGLESAKQAIEARIYEIHKQLTANGSAIVPPPAFMDASYLGRDVLGRIKRKRNISPEVRKQKQELIAKARLSRLSQLKEQVREEMMQAAAVAPVAPPPPPTVAPPPVAPVTKKKAPRG